jgi:two-component system, chemotaxis family, sensor kinase CheA
VIKYKKILIIDNDKKDIGAMKEILEKEGHKVSTATNGSDGIDIIKKKDFEIIIIDIKMPTLPGYDLLKILRDTLDNKIKIIYVSILPKLQVNMTGASGFLQKPFNKESLIKAIN